MDQTGSTFTLADELANTAYPAIPTHPLKSVDQPLKCRGEMQNLCAANWGAGHRDRSEL
jgi:hypothetical protein